MMRNSNMGINLSSYQVKIVDVNGLPLKHFPVATCYSGASNRNNKLTNNEGQVSFQSDGKAVDIFVLAPIQANGQPDKNFYKDDGDKDNVYYKIGTVMPSSMPPQLKSPYRIADYGQVTVNYEFYENQTTKKLFVAPFKVRVNYLKGENKDSAEYTHEDLEVKGGKLSILTILHSRIQVYPRKIDGTPLNAGEGISPRQDNTLVKMYFDIERMAETTKINEPTKKTDLKINDDLINIDKFIEEMKKNISKFTMKDKKAGNPKCNLNIFNEKSQSNLRTCSQSFQ